jgi:hypothetical protein
MSPLSYHTVDLHRHLHRRHIFWIACSFGLLAGFVSGIAFKGVTDGAAESTEWKPARIVCIAESHEGPIHSFTLENRTKADYVLVERYAWQIFARTPGGLKPALDAVLSTPLFIPKGEKVIVQIRCSAHGAFTVFDSSHHFRIELCGRQP